jgi:(heptosyl)LPS beta-1,4-glucosyltransferase
LLRVFRKEYGKLDGRAVHESIVVSGQTMRLSGFLLHDTHPTIERFVTKNLVNSRLWAKERSSTMAPSLMGVLFHPPAMFLKMYILKMGFLDGFWGFVLAVLYSYHVFIKYLILKVF